MTGNLREVHELDVTPLAAAFIPFFRRVTIKRREPAARYTSASIKNSGRAGQVKYEDQLRKLRADRRRVPRANDLCQSVRSVGHFMDQLVAPDRIIV